MKDVRIDYISVSLSPLNNGKDHKCIKFAKQITILPVVVIQWLCTSCVPTASFASNCLFHLPQIAYFICLKLLICWHILRLHIICSVLQSLFLEDTTTLATSSSIILATGLTGTVLLLIVIGVSVNKMRQGRKTVDVLEKGEESNSEMISPVTDVNNNRGSPPVLTTEFSIKATEASLEDRQN